MRTHDLAMSTQNIFFIGVVCLTFLDAALIRPGFDESECQGPIKIYEELNCSPVYRKSELTTCPFRYNCNHIKRRSPEKCYIDGKEINIKEKLGIEYTDDACTTCVCEKSDEGIASFQCLVNCCFQAKKVKKGCYLQKHIDQCCWGPQKCPESPEDIPTCNVNGSIFKDGDFFLSPGDPKTSCYCGPGWQGKYVEPFCLTSKKTECSLELNHGSDIFKKCAPIYNIGQKPQSDCSFEFRCQNSKDVVVIPQKFSPSFTRKARCLFGNLKLRIGHRLDRSSYYRSTGNCMDCICHLPPFLTCKKLESNDLCDDNADII